MPAPWVARAAHIGLQAGLPALGSRQAAPSHHAEGDRSDRAIKPSADSGVQHNTKARKAVGGVNQVNTRIPAHSSIQTRVTLRPAFVTHHGGASAVVLHHTSLFTPQASAGNTSRIQPTLHGAPETKRKIAHPHQSVNEPNQPTQPPKKQIPLTPVANSTRVACSRRRRKRVQRTNTNRAGAVAMPRIATITNNKQHNNKPNSHHPTQHHRKLLRRSRTMTQQVLLITRQLRARPLKPRPNQKQRVIPKPKRTPRHNQRNLPLFS